MNIIPKLIESDWKCIIMKMKAKINILSGVIICKVCPNYFGNEQALQLYKAPIKYFLFSCLIILLLV